jgi:hypothetical protein
MSGKWKEVTRLSFKGERFRDHALGEECGTSINK